MRRQFRAPQAMAGVLFLVLLAAVLPAGAVVQPSSAHRLGLPLEADVGAPFSAMARLCGQAPGAVQDPAPACTAELEASEQTEGGPTASTDGGAGLTEANALVTPEWWPQLATRDDGALVRVHGYGHVGVVDPDGTDAWTQSYVSLMEEWGLEQDEPRVAIIPLGLSADPLVPASERAFAVADVTGDGVDDVIVSHLFTTQVASPRQRLTVVSVLDGVDGSLRWHERFPGYVTQVVVQGTTLVLGVETGDVRGGDGAQGTTSHVAAFEVSMEPFALTEAWSVDTGTQWLRWLTAEPVGGTTVALGATSDGSGGLGALMVLDTVTGAVRWSDATDGYPRIIRHDPAAGHFVVVEQADRSAEDAYDVAIVEVATGTETQRVRHDDAIPLRAVLADLDGDGAAEVVVSDLARRPVRHGWLDMGRVTALDGADLGMRWQHVSDELTDGFVGVPYALAAAGDDVAVVWFRDDGNALLRPLEAEIGVLDGGTGGLRWRERDDLYPFFATVGDGTVTAATFEHALHGYDIDSGERVVDLPLVTQVHAAEVLDVDGDGGSELLIGTQSGGVFALVPELVADAPEWVWRANLGSPVHELQIADVTPDEGLEIVAVASEGVFVLARDGSVIHSFTEGEYTWTVTLADLSGDGFSDLVVPSRWLTAVSGVDGSVLWRYGDHDGALETYVSAPAITSDGTVVAQVAHHTAGRRSITDRAPNGEATQLREVILVDGQTGEVAARHQPDPQGWHTYRWRSTAVVPTAAGEAVALTYERYYSPLGRSTHSELVDPTTGERLWDRPVVNEEQNATVAYEDLLLVMNNGRLSVLDADGTSESAVPGGQDIAFPRLGDGTELVASTAFTRTWLNRAEALREPEAGEELGFHWRYLTGRMRAGDLDGDGSDELIGWRFDWAAYAEVQGKAGRAPILVPFSVPSALVIYELQS